MLAGDWVASALPSLVDEIVFGLLPRLLLHRQSQKTGMQLSYIVSKSVLPAQHALLSGMRDVQRKGIHVHKWTTFCILQCFFYNYRCLHLSTNT